MEAIWTPEGLRLWFISCVSNEGLLVRATADLFFKDSYGCLAGPALLPHRRLPACSSHCSATAHALSRPSAPRGHHGGGDSRWWAARSPRRPGHSSTQASAPRTHGRLGRPSCLALPAAEARKVQRDRTRRTSRQNTDPPAETAGVSAQKTLISNEHPTALHSNWTRGLLEP